MTNPRPRTLNRDDFDYEKTGRAVSEGHDRAYLNSRVRRLLTANGSGRGLRSTHQRARSKETVLKVVGWSKSRTSAFNQARYVSRERDADRAEQAEHPSGVSLENQDGDRLVGRAAIDAEIAGWGLKADHENRSKKWREADHETRRDMGVNDALHKRQTAHLIFSIPSTAETDHQALEAAVRDGLKETLGAQGFRYVFGIHTDHSERPHAHIIINAKSEPLAGDQRRSKQLRLNPRELHALRTTLTEAVNVRGIDVTATRRADREEIRDQVRTGQQPLRENRSRGKNWRAGLSQQSSIFEQKAPQWYAAHGQQYEERRYAAYEGRFATFVAPDDTPRPSPSPQRRAGFIERMKEAFSPSPATPPVDVDQMDPGKPAAPPTVEARRPRPAAQQDRFDRFFQITHRDPEAARARFIALAAEAPKLATWAANNHPSAFGEPTGEKAPYRLVGAGLQASLTPDELEQFTAIRARDGSPRLEEHSQRAQKTYQRAEAVKTDKQMAADRESLRRSLDRLAFRIEKESPDARAGDQAAAVHKLAEQVSQPGPAERSPSRQVLDRVRAREALERGQKQDRGLDR